MSVVAPITVAWQGIVDSVKNEAKEIETFDDLEEATIRAREVTEAAKDLQNNDYNGSNPQAHITIHPGTYQFGSSLDENTELEDVYVTILPGATVTDTSDSLPKETAANIADLNSFAKTGFFSQTQDNFTFDLPVKFRENVIFQENTFPVKRVEGGVGIRTDSSFGDVTVKHGRTGGASDNQDEDTFLNKVRFDNEGHVESANFEAFEKGVGVEDNSSDVLSLANKLNFTDNISAVNSQPGTATVKIPGTEDFEVSDFQNFLPIGKTLSEISGTTGVEAKLSSPPQGYSKNEIFPADTETEKGVVIPQDDVSGKLNPQVQSSTSHDSQTFSRASIGTLKLVLNDSDLVTLNLNQSDSSKTSKSQSGASSLSVSSTTPLSFPNEEVFSDVTQRTGTWEVGQSDMTFGLNTVKVIHESPNGIIGESQEIKYYLENTTFNTSIATPSFAVNSLEDVKYLSGVKYNKGGTVDFFVSANGVYQTVYEKGKAIKYPVAEGVDLSAEKIPELNAGESEDKQLNIQKTLDLSSDRILETGPKAQVEIEDSVEASVVSPIGTDLQLLVDQVSRQNEGTVHYFDSENLRAGPNEDFSKNVSLTSYDSTKSIRDDGAQGYSGELQVTEGKIIYPFIDYAEAENGPDGNPDYSENVSGQRTYYGIFTNPKAVSNFVLKVRGAGEIFSPGSISANNQAVAISIRVPGQTGWLDVSKPFAIGCHENGDGAYLESNAENPNLTIGPDSEIGLTIGKKSTSGGFNKLYYRIIAPEFWTGEITKMNINWGIE